MSATGRRALRAYDGVIHGLAIVAGASLALSFLLIVADVSLRAAGFRPPAATSAVTEYAMLVLTMGAAPWVVRQRGHVWVEVINVVAGAHARAVLARIVYLLCIGLCLTLAWYAGAMALDTWVRGEVDIRSIILPRWVLYAILATGFFFCATEFARFLLGADDMYRGDAAGGHM